jgi:hypothetical protein
MRKYERIMWRRVRKDWRQNEEGQDRESGAPMAIRTQSIEHPRGFMARDSAIGPLECNLQRGMCVGQ